MHSFVWAVDAPPIDDHLSRWESIERQLENLTLISVWWVVGFAVLALGFLALAIFVRPKWWLFLFVPLILASVVLAAATGFNLKFQYIKTVGLLVGLTPYDQGESSQINNPTGSWPRGLVVDATIPGVVSGMGTHPAKVYLPPEYFTEKDRKFPVLYILHGTPGVPVPGLGEDDGPIGLFTAADIDGAALKAAQDGNPVVLVAPVDSPVSGDSECVDGVQGRWQTYLAEDVVNWTIAQPRFKTGAANTGIAGYSMGGYCAQMTALRNPSKYGVSGNLSGTIKAEGPKGEEALFGSGRGAAEAVNYDSLNIIETKPESRSVTLWLLIGAQDATPWVTGQQKFAEAARAQGMKVIEQEPVGTHSFPFWTANFRQWIVWTAADLYGNNPPVPPPADAS